MSALGKKTQVALLSTHPGGEERIGIIEQNLNLLMPLYAKAKGTTADRLPPYRTVAAVQ